jgi:hypothetical protein
MNRLTLLVLRTVYRAHSLEAWVGIWVLDGGVYLWEGMIWESPNKGLDVFLQFDEK